jgi:hypothetical protein
VLSTLKTWLGQLDKNDAEYWRHKLEALWLHQALDEPDTALLQEMLRCPEPKARAAATRVLCYTRERVQNPLELLQVQINDEHPRVRLEAIRALSFFDGPEALKAQETALELLQHPMDYYLEYTLNETGKTLDKRIKMAEESK